MATEIAPESTLASASALAQFDAELEGQQTVCSHPASLYYPALRVSQRERE
jgi:hypothetical protein